jgi:SLT domain-containing protein
VGTSDNIYDPVANIAASMRYVMSRYHVEPKAGANFDVFESHRHAGGYTGY